MSNAIPKTFLDAVTTFWSETGAKLIGKPSATWKGPLSLYTKFPPNVSIACQEDRAVVTPVL